MKKLAFTLFLGCVLILNTAEALNPEKNNPKNSLDSALQTLKYIYPELILPTVEEEFATMELSNFNVQNIDNQFVLLDWSTALKGYQPDMYLIERWTEQNGWVVIERIKGELNQDDMVSFSYLDRNPSKGNSFYRLINADPSGKTYTTDVKTVMMYDETKYKFKQDKLKHYFTLVNLTNVEELDKIQIFTISGVDVSEKVFIERPKNNTAVVRMERLETGMYHIKSGEFATQIFKL